MRTRRVALIHAVQNFAQLDDIYGRARHPTIVTNANTHIVSDSGREKALEVRDRPDHFAPDPSWFCGSRAPFAPFVRFEVQDSLVWRKRTGAGTVGALDQGNTALKKLLQVNGNLPEESTFWLSGRLFLALLSLVIRHLLKCRGKCLALLFRVAKLSLFRTDRCCILCINLQNSAISVRCSSHLTENETLIVVRFFETD